MTRRGSGQSEAESRAAEFALASGLSFRDPRYLELALLHASFANEHPRFKGQDNQRLEYLGDSVLGFLVAEWLYERYPDAQEGDLTRLRAEIVRSESLARLGRDLRIGEFLRMGRGEEATGGRTRDANLAAAVEAIIGAVYLDRGLDVTRALVRRFLDESAEGIDRQRMLKNAKSHLQEHVQQALGVTPVYETVAQQGPPHALEFTARVVVGGDVWGTGAGRTKQAAEQAAARAAIEERGI